MWVSHVYSYPGIHSGPPPVLTNIVQQTPSKFLGTFLVHRTNKRSLPAMCLLKRMIWLFLSVLCKKRTFALILCLCLTYFLTWCFRWSDSLLRWVKDFSFWMDFVVLWQPFLSGWIREQSFPVSPGGTHVFPWNSIHNYVTFSFTHS